MKRAYTKLLLDELNDIIQLIVDDEPVRQEKSYEYVHGKLHTLTKELESMRDFYNARRD